MATANSKSSRWCPWEIGFADSSQKGIFIIPTTDGYDNYGNEYLELYNRIDNGTLKLTGKSIYAFFKAGESEGTLLTNSVFK